MHPFPVINLVLENEENRENRINFWYLFIFLNITHRRYMGKDSQKCRSLFGMLFKANISVMRNREQIITVYP